MITIIGHKQRKNSDGEPFNVLVLRGEVEMVKSAETGQFYATAKETTIPSTFDEATCEGLVGKKMPGTIERVPCDPYEYKIEETGETIILEHSYEYNPAPVTMEEEVFESQPNGVPA